MRRVIQPLLATSVEPSFSQEDLDYVRDLGLIACDDPVRMANPIYREVVPRQLTAALQARLASAIDPQSFSTPQGAVECHIISRSTHGII